MTAHRIPPSTERRSPPGPFPGRNWSGDPALLTSHPSLQPCVSAASRRICRAQETIRHREGAAADKPRLTGKQEKSRFYLAKNVPGRASPDCFPFLPQQQGSHSPLELRRGANRRLGSQYGNVIQKKFRITIAVMLRRPEFETEKSQQRSNTEIKGCDLCIG